MLSRAVWRHLAANHGFLDARDAGPGFPPLSGVTGFVAAGIVRPRRS
jgi:hypothetical protein